MQAPYSSIPFVIMGFSSMLLQITVLRLLLSTFSGNELDIGITLSFWLIYAGLGSFTGRRVQHRQAFIVSLILIALFALPTVISIKAIRPLLSLEPGEAASFFSTMLSTAIVLFPLCFLIGLQFPAAVSYSGLRNAAGRVFGLEAIGAFIAGILFTFIFASRLDVMTLSLLIALLNITTAIWLSRKILIILTLVVPLSVFAGFHDRSAALPWKGLNLVKITDSRYGEIAVIKVRNQSSIYSNGRLMFTYPDVQDEEMRVHLPMTLHPSPRQILVIGGSPGMLREFLKYPADGVAFLETDPKIIEVLLDLLGPEDRDALNDPRVKVIIRDGRKFIKGSKKSAYDLVILNLPQPFTAGINRFYTTEFFREVQYVLKEKGILAVNFQQSTGYIGKRMQMASGSVYSSLQSVFRHVAVTTQEYGGIFASGSAMTADPDFLEKRFVQRTIHTRHFSQYIFRDAFSPLNVGYVKTRLGEIKTVNTDLHPSAYLYNLLLWGEIHGGKFLYHLIRVKEGDILIFSSVFLVLISFLILGKKDRVISFSVLTTGFSGMSLTLAVILAYQSRYGYVYEMIGLLSAVFMTGLWAGSLLTKDLRRPLKLLFLLDAAAVLLAVTAPLFFRSEAPFYLLVLFSGIITGWQFSTATHVAGKPAAAGKLYALDLFGSCAGALVPSLALIPLFGIYKTLLFIALLKGFSAIMVLSLRNAVASRVQ